MTVMPKPGQWVRWVTNSLGREGEVISTRGISFTVRWLGVDDPQTFPWGFIYFDPAHPSAHMEIIKKPAGIAQDRQQRPGDALTLPEAAALLGITSRSLRIKLRSGKVRGLKDGKHWVGVYLED